MNDDWSNNGSQRAEPLRSERPTRPSRPAVTIPPLALPPRPPSPFAIVSSVLEATVEPLRATLPRSLEVVLSRGGSTVALVRSDDLARLVAVLVLEVASAVPSGTRGGELHLSSHVAGERVVVELMLQFQPGQVTHRMLASNLLESESLAPGGSMELAGELGVELELDDAPGFRLYLPLGSR